MSRLPINNETRTKCICGRMGNLRARGLLLALTEPVKAYASSTDGVREMNAVALVISELLAGVTCCIRTFLGLVF